MGAPGSLTLEGSLEKYPGAVGKTAAGFSSRWLA